MIKVATALALMLGVGVTSASAATVPKHEMNDGAAVVHVQDRHHDRRDRDRRGRRPPPRWEAGRHYDRSPPGWHRHHRRPHDWRRRGCVVVGPVWFCP